MDQATGGSFDFQSAVTKPGSTVKSYVDDIRMGKQPELDKRFAEMVYLINLLFIQASKQMNIKHFIFCYIPYTNKHMETSVKQTKWK